MDVLKLLKLATGVQYGTMGSFLTLKKKWSNPCQLSDLTYIDNMGKCQDTCPYRIESNSYPYCILTRGAPYA